ncbi:hypothetical protein [Halotia branconii]|uniref:Uncharacterized protein n=1 Tax=Halotia branconii CENA392 TaxID=1539056 RepID=A0AAJ6NSE3_9CYAN|nr:hypothetical protein [Halotia branconii]WGV25732.1 hypothetical protein QI031_29110 [Halotia branconii CENA392]
MNVSIRLLQANELAIADHVFRLAFGTFVGLPEPTEFYGDAAYIEVAMHRPNEPAYNRPDVFALDDWR